jgi:hypothetical protein
MRYFTFEDGIHDTHLMKFEFIESKTYKDLIAHLDYHTEGIVLEGKGREKKLLGNGGGR